MKRIEDAADALMFLLAGNAHFTLVSAKTGTRYTYHVRKSDDSKVHFVSVMYGPNNETDYAYMGVINRDGEFRSTKKSKVNAHDPRFVAFDWAYRHMLRGNLPVSLEMWHEGRCGRCARLLTVPSSIASGIGPECAKIMCEAT